MRWAAARSSLRLQYQPPFWAAPGVAEEPSGDADANAQELRANAARTARPCGESFLELIFQALGCDVVFGLDLQRDLDPDPRGLEVDDVDVVGHVLPV